MCKVAICNFHDDLVDLDKISNLFKAPYEEETGKNE